MNSAARRGKGIKTRKGAAPPAATNMIDRFAGWLGRRPRWLRIVMAAVIAVILTGTATLLVYNYLFSLPPERFSTSTVWIVLTVLAIGGAGLYYLGWRLLVGFEVGPAEEGGFQLGRAGAAWVLFGFVVLWITVIVAVFNAIQAVGPV